MAPCCPHSFNDLDSPFSKHLVEEVLRAGKDCDREEGDRSAKKSNESTKSLLRLTWQYVLEEGICLRQPLDFSNSLGDGCQENRELEQREGCSQQVDRGQENEDQWVG